MSGRGGHKKKRPPRIGRLRKCAGCGSYRGASGMVHRQLAAGVVWHCAGCWRDVEEAARRDRCHVMAELVARYRSRMGPMGVAE